MKLYFLEIVENWHTKYQGHKKRWAHYSSLRVRPCHATPHVFSVVLYRTEQRQVVKHFLDAVYVWVYIRRSERIGNCLQVSCDAWMYFLVLIFMAAITKIQSIFVAMTL